MGQSFWDGLESEAEDAKRGGHTFTDSQFHSSDPTKRIGINEDKVGPGASMTPRQTQAQAQPDIDYVVNGYRYNDFGKMFGASVSPYGAQLVDQGGYPWAAPQD